MAITRDDWMQALSDAGICSDVDDQDAVTAVEFARLFNVPLTTARARLHALVARGTATRTKKYAKDVQGRIRHTDAYRLNETPKAAPRRAVR